MAIDYHDGQDLVHAKAPVYPPAGLFQPTEQLKTTGEEELHNLLVKNQDCHWAKLYLNGTATEKKEENPGWISIIAQPECENNPLICPTSHQGPLYSPDAKQYNLAESNEHIPNNVANSTEGKLAQAKHFTKSKRKRRKKSIKEDDRTPVKRGPQQESRAPVPVQDEESQEKPWGRNDIPDSYPKQPDHHHHEKHNTYTPQNTPPTEGKKNALHKLIYPSQYIYHIGAGKLQPPGPPRPVSPYYNNRLPGIISALGLDGWEDKISPKWGGSKFEDSCTDSETHSVEEGVLSALRGSVSMGEPKYLCLMAKDWGNGGPDGEPVDNEGILLQKQMMPEDYEYREDIHWDKSEEPLGSGSFGDVYLGKDKTSGFQFAAKKIHVDRFRSQEVTCFLSGCSDKILPLYGAVREGPWITVFTKMINGGSLGQMIKRCGYLAEDQALFYLSQVLEGLTSLHAAGVIHGDVKADNVLLSEDGNSAYLCDFGHAAHLPPGSAGTNLLTENYVPGTETHMAPEIVRGDPCDTKLDVWSACCMFLHMVNGWHPWSRTHCPPLCLKIATEPPPLEEIPPSCHPVTCDLLVAGLQKDPKNRATAAELKHRVDEALKKTGGLKSPNNREYREPRKFPSIDREEAESRNSRPALFPEERTEAMLNLQHAGDPGQDSFTTNARSTEQTRTSCEMEIERLEIDLYMENLSQALPLEDHQQMFLREDSLAPLHSGKDSMNTSDARSSGVYSWDSQMEDFSLQSDSLFSGGNTATPSWFNGVKVRLRTFSGDALHIWESGKTKLGDLAVGISSQIPIKSFTILNSKGNPMPWKTDIADCGVELQCALAPDRGGAWIWRVKKGKMEDGGQEAMDIHGGRDCPDIFAAE